MYTVTVTANNIVGPSKKTSVDFSMLTGMFIIYQILLDVRFLQNVNYKNFDITNIQDEVVYWVERNDLNVILLYSNDTKNIKVIDTKVCHQYISSFIFS